MCTLPTGRNVYKVLNIDTVAKYCKNWLIENQMCVSSGNGMLKDKGYYCSVDGFMPTDEHIEYGQTEHEAIFKACEWILKELK